MDLLQVVGLVATVFTTGAYVPQALKIIKTKSTQSLSVPTYLMLSTGSMIWVYYAFTRNDIPVMIANGVTGILAMVILSLKFTAKKPAEKIN
jgi:MtN3 and saliva related transmembrane protein